MHHNSPLLPEYKKGQKDKAQENLYGRCSYGAVTKDKLKKGNQR